MRLRVHFPTPGFFLNDPPLSVRLGDRTLYDGSFRKGFDVSVAIAPGHYVLETTLGRGPFARRQQIELPLSPDGGYRDIPEVHAELSYNRLTGNFARRADLSVQR